MYFSNTSPTSISFSRSSLPYSPTRITERGTWEIVWRTTETFRKRWVCRKTENELVDVELLDYPIRKCNSETEKRERRFGLESSRVVPCGARRLIFIGMREVTLKPAPAWRSLQSLRIFRSQPCVSSINFKAASDATCNTFSGALPNSPSWPCSLFPPVIHACF